MVAIIASYKTRPEIITLYERKSYSGDMYFGRYCSFSLTGKDRNVSWNYVLPLKIGLNICFSFALLAIPDRNILFVLFRLRSTPTKPSGLISVLLLVPCCAFGSFSPAEFRADFEELWLSLDLTTSAYDRLLAPANYCLLIVGFVFVLRLIGFVPDSIALLF